MPAGRLKSLFAYEVEPQQPAPQGGKVRANRALEDVLNSAYDRSPIAKAPAVTLRIDLASTARSHPIRDAAMTVAFGTPPAGLTAAAGLAARLAGATDQRSKPSLLLVSAHEVPGGPAGDRRVLLWTFPREEVFRLDVGASTRLSLDAAFNRESNLRKAAVLTGGNGRGDFLSAAVLDLQSGSADRAVADLWIVKFLDATMQMSKGEGTRLLARALRTAHDRLGGNVDAQAQIHAAITGLRSSGRTRWSLNDVATTYLGPSAAAPFRAAARPEELTALFDMDTDAFDKLVQFRVFRLDNGVFVSAPFSEIGTDALQIAAKGDGRELVARGLIEEEKVRTRGA